MNNVEHIFYHLDSGSEYYRLQVRQVGDVAAAYSIAWWGEEAPDDQVGVSVSGCAFDDSDDDGTHDISEEGAPHAQVDLVDSQNVVVKSTTTDYYGRYLFEGVPAGNYKIHVVAPYSFGFTQQDAGSNDTQDSDVNSTGWTYTFSVSTTDITDVDAGFSSLEYGSVGGRVWNDENGNGVQDSGEEGLSGVRATLFDSTDNEIGNVLTDEGGEYLFLNVAPDNYYARFKLPGNYTSTAKDVGSNDLTDSDIDAEGRIDTFSLSTNQAKSDLDAGMVLARGSIFGRVWVDFDHNGIQGEGELGIEGAIVSLYTSANSLVEAVTSDEDGNYLFKGIVPGSYYILFDSPFGLMSSTGQNSGSDDEADSDADIAGVTSSFDVEVDDWNTSIDAGFQTIPNIGQIDVSTNEDNSIVISVLEFVGDAEGDPLFLTIATGPTHGTAVVDDNGTPIDFSDDIITYAPVSDYFGLDELTYELDDGYGGTVSALISISITSVNDAPTVDVPSLVTVEDQPIVFNAASNTLITIADPEGGTMTVTIYVLEGWLILSGSTGLTFAEGDSANMNFSEEDVEMTFWGSLANVNAALNGMIFTPPANYYYEEALMISVSDSAGAYSVWEEITIHPVNDAPTGANNTVYTSQNTDYVFGISDFGFSDTVEGDSFLAVQITTLASSGTLYWHNGTSWVAVIANQFISASDIASGKLKYTPPANTTGSPTFGFHVQDDGGTEYGGIDLDLTERFMTIAIT